MNLTEDQLTRTLADHAHDAPAADGLLDAVRRLSRQHARRRAAMTTGALGLLVAAAVGAAVLPTRDAPAVLAWDNAAESKILIPADVRPSFPLTPTVLPDGLAEQPRLQRERGTDHAAWELQEPGRDVPLSGLSIAVSATEPDRDELAPARTADIDGAAATVVPYDSGLTVVVWQRRPGQWVAVSGFAPVSEAQTVAAARSLTDAPVRQPADFDVEVAPEGYVLAEYHRGGLTLGPAGGQPNPQDDPRAIVVAARAARSQTDGQGEAVRVGDRDGWLDERDGRYRLVLRLDDDARLEITTPAGGPWSHDELARLAEGISYRGDAPRTEG